jgi:hypothetical protein
MKPEEGLPYAWASDFARALVDRIASAAKSSPYGVAEIRRQFAYSRLLARVFIHAPDDWVVKGAAGLLARIPGRVRHSIDIDLYFAGEFDAALGALREATDVDLGDYFTFNIDRGAPLTGVAAGGQLSVTAYLGDKEFERFKVDVVVTHTMTAEPEEVSPIDPVEVPGLRNVALYRIYPIADQIADKHAATMSMYAGRPSTRYRDLVDLVLITLTQTVEANDLDTALVSEHQRRGTDLAVPLSLPSDDWRKGYRKIAESVPYFDILDPEDAVVIVRRLVDPVINGLRDATWDPNEQEWRK